MRTINDFRVLLSKSTTQRVVLAILGSVLTALADAAGVLAILPLMQLLTGSPTDEGVLGKISTMLGDPSDTNLATFLAAFTFGAFAAKGVISIFFKWWLLGFLAKQEAETSEHLLRYYLAAPYGLHLKRNSAELIRTLNDAVRNAYTGQVVVGVVNIISELCTIIAVATILLILIPGPALLLLAYFALAGAVLYGIVRPMTHRAGVQMLAAYSTIYQGAMQALGGIKEIKIRHKSAYFLESYRKARDSYAESQRRAVFFGEMPRYIMEILFIFGIGITTVFVFATSPSAESIGVLAILAASGFRLLPSAVRMLAAMNVVRFGRPSFDLVVSEIRDAQALGIEDQSPQQAEGRPVQQLHAKQEIRFDHVTFSHDGQAEPAVRDVSFSFPVGSAVAFVGPSGAGKSTLVDLFLGLQKPDTGSIWVDGTQLQSVMPEWQRSLGLVPQEVYLLDTSLRENIAFGERVGDIDDARLAVAVSGAQLDEFVASLPEGLETQVGERGVRLSGGQRQRIGIARALYSEPDFLVLDEATSALDNETERRISETINKLHGSVSILIVAHRLSTVRDCDRIVYLQDGRVEAVGTFEELQDMSHDFARLVELGRLH